MFQVIYVIACADGTERECAEPATHDRVLVITAVCAYRAAGLTAWIEPA